MLVLAVATAISAPGCRACGEDRGRAPAPVDAAAEPAEPAEVAEPEAAPAEPAEPRPPARQPQLTAQRFVVGFASGRVADLEAASADRAADLVRRFVAGETVETPLGPLSAESPPATSFSFSEVSLAPTGSGLVRIALTATLGYRDQPSSTTRHAVVVRLEDGAVLDWTTPTGTASEPGGV